MRRSSTIRLVIEALQTCCKPHHLKATAGAALIVGTWLSLVNQADVVASQGIDWPIFLKLSMNYLTPFVVSNVGLLSRRS